jgi:mono/diheme cytochrome c family protein
MKRPFRWVGISLGGLAGLGITACAIVYMLSERIVRQSFPVPSVAISLTTDPESILEGRRLATIHGCFNGCHGKEVEGSVLFDEPLIARIVAPNLTTLVRQYSDAQFAVAVRSGLRPDGRSLIVMPAESFSAMTDADLGRIMAFLKSLPPATGPIAGASVGPLARIGLVAGKFKTAAQLVADAVPPPAAVSQQATFGRYLAQTTCVQCHGSNLRGAATPDFISPDLRIVAGYSLEAFSELMRTGMALGGRKLGVMSGWARNNLSHLTDGEIAALYSYLHTLALN